MPNIKISASVGNLAFAYEGENSLFEEKFGTVMDRLSDLSRSLPGNFTRDKESAEPPSKVGNGSSVSNYSGTINTLVAKVGGDSCSELLKAAAAHLTLYEGKDRFSSTEWDNSAKDANLWKASYTNSKSTDKKRLVASGFIIENAKDTYSLSPSARRAMEEKIAS